MNEQQIKRMIDYLTEHTDYKILTNDEYQILKPVAHSTPSAARERGGARPKDQIRNDKFEDQSHMQNQLTDGHTSVVYDATNVWPRSGEEKSETSFEV